MQATRLEWRSQGLSARRGFTLVELMITVAVVAALALIALPSYREVNRRTTVTEIGNSLVTAMNLARAEAVKRGVRTAVVATAGGNNWSTGWTVRADGNANNAFTDAVDDTLQSRAAIANTTNYKVTSRGTGAGASDGQIVFGIDGTLALGTSFDFNVCRISEATNSTHIVVNGAGMVTSYRSTAGSPAPGC